MLKQILATIGVNVPLHIPDITDIASITNISTNSPSDITNPPTYEHLHRNLLPEKGWKEKLVPYKKYLMSFITIVNSNHQLGRPKLIQIFLFGLKNMSFLCSLNLFLNNNQILKRKKNQI